MKFNKEEELAINLLDFLKSVQGYKTARELAKELATTEIFLHSIVLKLKKANLVETITGTNGGVKRVNRSINVLDVLHALKKVPPISIRRMDQVLTNVLNLLKKEEL